MSVAACVSSGARGPAQTSTPTYNQTETGSDGSADEKYGQELAVPAGNLATLPPRYSFRIQQTVLLWGVANLIGFGTGTMYNIQSCAFSDIACRKAAFVKCVFDCHRLCL